MTKHHTLTRAALVLCLAASAAHAQTTPPPAAPDAAASSTAPSTGPVAPNPEIVELSEFKVSEKSSNSYIASETMSGSRVNTKIVDLPYSIVNLTSEFFNDFNIQMLDENMTYIGGLTGLGIGGAFNLQGFSSTSQLKDGFYRLGRYGLSNIDRIEVIRGPNAAIYGRSSPGGMVNFVSLQPSQNDTQTISYSQGTFDQAKANLMLTGTVDPNGKTYYVIDVNQTDRGSPEEYAHIRNSEEYISIEHDFSNSSHLKISGEYFMQIQDSPASGAPLLAQTITAVPGNTATTSYITGPAYDYALGSFNAYGPNSELDRGSRTGELSYDKEFNEVFSMRTGIYKFSARRWDYNQNTGWGTVTLPIAGSTAAVTDTRGSLPSRGEIMEDGGGFQQDFKAHYWLFGHKIENNTLVTVDFNDYYRWDPTWEYAANADGVLQAWNAAGSGRVVTLAPSLFHGRMDYVPQGPIAYFPDWFTPQNLTLIAPPGNENTGGASLNGGSLTRRRTSSIGGNARQQMLLLDGRLIVYGGIRNDTVRFSERDYTHAFTSVGFGSEINPAAGIGGANQPGGSVIRRYEHEDKPNAGFNLQVLPNLHVYGSYSTAYFVDQTAAPTIIASSTYAPFTAKGYDYGIKGSYFQERLNFTLGGFYGRQYNVLVTDTTEYAPGLYTDIPSQDGDQLVRGWEADLSWAVTPEFTIGESLGDVNSKYTYYGSAFPEAVGRNVAGISPQNGSAYMKYNIDSGYLKGMYFNLMTTYVAKTPTQAPNAGDTTAIVNGVSVLTATTYQWMVTLPSYETWNFGAHYIVPKTWFGPKWEHRIDLNLNNLFNKYYLRTNGLRGDSRAVLIQYTIKHSGYRL